MELVLLPRAVLYAAVVIITLIILDWLAARRSQTVAPARRAQGNASRAGQQAASGASRSRL
jgi:hypothetical protein